MQSPIDVKVTPEGLENLKKELVELAEKRPGVLARMVAAREQGDLSENAGYHAAKEELGHIDRRTRELKLMIRFAQIIAGGDHLAVSLGSNVVVDDGSGQREFKIVGKIEANPMEGKMSDESPIGMALLGKKVGDVVSIEVPDGKAVYKVVSIASTKLY